MNRNRLATSLAIAAAVICLIPAAAALADSAPHAALQTPKPAPSDARAKADSIADDFAGLTYSDEQKIQIAKIRQDSESKMSLVASSKDLNGDQKDAMILGYTRMEYGQIYKVLTPEQQKQVRKRVQDRKLADQAAQRKQNPHK
jgi:Spy/CpxP family protein refolding chaperone